MLKEVGQSWFSSEDLGIISLISCGLIQFRHVEILHRSGEVLCYPEGLNLFESLLKLSINHPHIRQPETADQLPQSILGSCGVGSAKFLSKAGGHSLKVWQKWCQPSLQRELGGLTWTKKPRCDSKHPPLPLVRSALCWGNRHFWKGEGRQRRWPLMTCNMLLRVRPVSSTWFSFGPDPG